MTKHLLESIQGWDLFLFMALEELANGDPNGPHVVGQKHQSCGNISTKEKMGNTGKIQSKILHQGHILRNLFPPPRSHLMAV